MRQMGLTGVNPPTPAMPATAYAARRIGRAATIDVLVFWLTEDSTHSDAGRGTPMRRLVLAACLAALITAGAVSTSHAALVAGIGDQNSSTFTDPNFKKLKVKRTRLIVPYDAVLREPGASALKQWLTAVRAAKLKPLVAFNPTGGSRCPAKPCSIPSVRAYTKAFKAFRKKYPFVKEFNFWNETNSATQPTGSTKASTLKKTAKLYVAAKKVCGRKCRVSGPDLLDQGVGDKRRSVRVRNQKRMAKWVGLFLKYAGRKNYPKLWGIHNYGDTNYGRSTGTAFMLNSIAKKGEVWVTETGGIYSFRTQGGSVVFKANASRQAKATTNAYKVAKKFSKRIKRLYYYQWRKNNAGDFFDAGIVDFAGALRPAYASLRKLPKSVWK